MAAGRIASWDGSRWAPLAGGVDTTSGTSVTTLLAMADGLLVGGQFGTAGGTVVTTWHTGTAAAGRRSPLRAAPA